MNKQIVVNVAADDSEKIEVLAKWIQEFDSPAGVEIVNVGVEVVSEAKAVTLEQTESGVRNVVYNPNFDGLRTACRDASESGFGLSHVVPVTEYEWVAVFMRTPDVSALLPELPTLAEYEDMISTYARPEEK